MCISDVVMMMMMHLHLTLPLCDISVYCLVLNCKRNTFISALKRFVKNAGKENCVKELLRWSGGHQTRRWLERIFYKEYKIRHIYLFILCLLYISCGHIDASIYVQCTSEFKVIRNTWWSIYVCSHNSIVVSI